MNGKPDQMYEGTGDTTTLAEAAQASRDTVAATPDNHPRRTPYLSALGNALGRTGDTRAVVEGGRCFTRATAISGAPAMARIRAYRQAAGLAGQAGGTPQDALAAVEAAVGLLPQVARHRHPLAHQRHHRPSPRPRLLHSPHPPRHHPARHQPRRLCPAPRHPATPRPVPSRPTLWAAHTHTGT